MATMQVLKCRNRKETILLVLVGIKIYCLVLLGLQNRSSDKLKSQRFDLDSPKQSHNELDNDYKMLAFHNHRELLNLNHVTREAINVRHHKPADRQKSDRTEPEPNVCNQQSLSINCIVA